MTVAPKPYWWSLIPLALLLLLLWQLDPVIIRLQTTSTDDSGVTYSLNAANEPLQPGVMNDRNSMLRYASFYPYDNVNFSIPLYTTNDLSKYSEDIKHAIIIQHGNLRNANDYFSGAVNSFKESIGSNPNLATSTIVIAPLFLNDQDLCWDIEGNVKNVNILNKNLPIVTCSHPIWSSEGWKDGHFSISNHTYLSPSHEYSGISSSNSLNKVYSYDVFNIIIRRLSNKLYFPSLNNITFFGFSAGAQTVLRYSILPNTADKIPIKYIVSDPSTYLYFNNLRPLPVSDTNYEFAVPDINLIDKWHWINDWKNNCTSYNSWRYGLEHLKGYYEHHLKTEEDIDMVINKFQYTNVVYLVGMNDTLNCRLRPFDNCDDNELATYCQAMLQGDNRVDRALKYKAYLTLLYRKPVHEIIIAPNVPHDPVKMLHSTSGKCVVLGIC